MITCNPMERLRNKLTALVYFFPVSLLIRQMHKHKVLLLFWLFLMAIAAGWVGKSFGGMYLFLEPEYLGKENFWSFFFIGSALGGFLFAYMITFYINESYRFHFVALTSSPFYTLSFNNLLVPGSFLLFYFYNFLHYHIGISGGLTWMVWEKLMGMLMGMSVIFLFSASYFFAKQRFMSRFVRQLMDRIIPGKSQRSRWIILGKARESYRLPQRTDSYLAFPFQVVKVGKLQTTQLKSLIRTLNQHHGKLLIMQIGIIVMISTLSLLERNPIFQIPAGASFLLIYTLAMMMFGAITFWFRKSGMLTLVVGALLLYLGNNGTFFKGYNPAFGMNYSVEPAAYDEQKLQELSAEHLYNSDREHTIAMLERWKANYQQIYGRNRKPKAIFVTASGGGLRSAFWTFRIMQELDSLTDGQIGQEMRLMSGASGGMYGLTYFRELYWRKLNGEIECLQNNTYSNNISKDLLNRIGFRTFADLLMPTQETVIDGHLYPLETGYSFDDQLAINLPELKGRKLGHYARPEKEGLLPVVIMEPSIINQGRKLYISASPVSFLSRGNRLTDQYFSRASGVEFRRLFEKQDADSLYLTTALRMNSTFPLVLPVVELPSEPAMQVMDAGAIDNYGTQTAIKYLHEFKDWFAENTQGVIVIQIRDHSRDDPIDAPGSEGIFSKFLTPLGGGYNSLIESKDMSNDYLLEYVHEWYEGYIEVIPIAYSKNSNQDRASLSWHLTRREKQNIETSLYSSENQKAFEMIQALYQPGLIAQRLQNGYIKR